MMRSIHGIIMIAFAAHAHPRELVSMQAQDMNRLIDQMVDRLTNRSFAELSPQADLDNTALGKPATRSLPTARVSSPSLANGHVHPLQRQYQPYLSNPFPPQIQQGMLQRPVSLRDRHYILPQLAASKAEVPEGTPVVKPLPIRKRPRRNRRSSVQRDMFAETVLTPANFIMPVFVHDGTEDIPISAMPGISRLGVDTGLLREVGEARELGVKSVVIFPKTPDDLKTGVGEEAFNPEGLAQRAIRNVKEKFPDVIVYTDVALDPYNSLGHDGIVRSDGVILNDETVHQLCKQAVSQAEAGADYVSPSDMMDGRVGAIRDALDAAGFTDVGIMAYSAKYNSAFYGPFREALDSAPVDAKEWVVPKDKAEYQQNAANFREALLEARLDEEEGADILMVKPGMPYLDIIKGLHDNIDLPIAAYHVSGEYAMLKAASQNGWLNERAAALEALLSIKRAGATVILTYYAKQAAKWLLGKE